MVSDELRRTSTGRGRERKSVRRRGRRLQLGRDATRRGVQAFEKILSQAALRRCREKYGAELDPEYRLPARKYAGARPPTRQWIRANAPVVVSSTPSAEDVLDGGCSVLEHRRRFDSPGDR